MRRPRSNRPTSLLLIGLVACAGCSTTIGSKLAGNPSPPRSIAVVGDRPLPPKVGEPGAEVVADSTEPEPRRDARARISGRVLDAKGRPVPDATVRLADGGTKGGRDVSTTTDRSGAFTLGGLRPGSSYWLVAETEDGRESGRARANTADTGVKISLGDDGGNGDDSSPARPRLGRPTRARPISDREEVEDDAPGVNAEDLPPAEDAPAEPTSRKARPNAPEPAVGWRRPGEVTRVTRRPAREADPVAESSEEEEGPNPLPPAIVPGSTEDDPAPAQPRPPRPKAAARVAPPTADLGTLTLADEPRPSIPGPTVAAEPPPMPAVVFDPPTAEAEPAPSLAQQAPTPPADPPPPAPTLEPSPTSVPTKPASEPVFASAEPAGEYNPFALVKSDRIALVAADVPLVPGEDTPPASPSVDSPKPVETSVPPKKWGDVAVAEPKPSPKPTAEPARLTSLITRRLHPQAVARPSTVALCDFDPKQRRVVDLRLPDLEGRPVRLRDLDADLVLIDFWGTWCKPCLDSIPHLVELQKRYGPGKLKVVGVACEKSQGDRSRAEVDAFARKLGINYAVLLSAMDGSCPVQKALNVRYYPTMILLDRRGKILWTAEGATPANLYRLDRALATATGKVETVRR